MNDLIKGAIARFAAKHGRKLWKTELRKCWSRSSYPGMGSDDSSYLQMARNSGVDLDKLTYDELTTPAPTTLVFQANGDHGLLDVDNSDCELRVHIKKSDDGYYLQGLAVDITTEEQQADGWYAFNDLVSCEDAFETIGALVPDCAWFTGGRWVWSELPDAVNCAKLFADALGVAEQVKPQCECNHTDSYCPVHNGKGVESEPLTLVLTEEDAGELYFAFRQRGECSTRSKVAEFLRQVEFRHGRPLKGEWFDCE